MPDRIIRGINGPRGSALLSAALIAWVHVAAYATPHSGIISAGLDAMERSIPAVIPAALWAVAATLATVGAWRRRDGLQRDRADAWGWGAVGGMCILWAAAFLAGWLVRGLPPEGLAYSLLYVGVSGLIAAAARMTNPGSGRRRERR